MLTHADNKKEDKTSRTQEPSRQRTGGEAKYAFADNRPVALIQWKLRALADNSPRSQQIAQLQAMADNHRIQRHQPVRKKNTTGLPNQLKTGIEQLSGYSMDYVSVQYNSAEPAQLQAHAFAQGTTIHLAPGQEQHLPHEAWHVVQQMQGRVRPTIQLKNKTQVNDDDGLEREADVMGNRAAATTSPLAVLHRLETNTVHSEPVVQRETTISGHGDLRRDNQNRFVPYRVPEGKTIVLSAPPGATLGDISSILNTRTNIDPAAMRELVVVNTTDDIWKNKGILELIEQNDAIPKSAPELSALNALLDGHEYDNLSALHKQSLAELEGSAPFEAWARELILPYTFKVMNAGDNIHDMKLTPFEDALRSADDETSDQNDYIEQDTNLSDYVQNHPDEVRFVVNACSFDPDAEFTGFQIDVQKD